MKNSFSKIHPFPCFLYYIGVFVLSMLIIEPVALITGIISLSVLNYFQDGGKSLKQNIYMYLFVGISLILFNVLLSHRGATVLFYLFDNSITLESIFYGTFMALSISSVFIAFLSFNITITSDKITYLFSKFFKKATFVLSLSIRLVPVFKIRISEIYTIQTYHARQAESATYKLNGFIGKIKIGVRCIAILTAWSLEEALITCQSMKSRGYGISKRSSFYSTYRFTLTDFIFTVLVIFIFTTVVLTWQFGEISFTVYPKVSFGAFNVERIYFYVLYLAYFCLPYTSYFLI